MTHHVAAPLVDVEIAVISGESTRLEVAEALAHANAGAKRMGCRDSLSSLSGEHAARHAFINSLLDLWQAAA